jgi:hypothetical protein
MLEKAVVQSTRSAMTDPTSVVRSGVARRPPASAMVPQVGLPMPIQSACSLERRSLPPLRLVLAQPACLLRTSALQPG